MAKDNDGKTPMDIAIENVDLVDYFDDLEN